MQEVGRLRHMAEKARRLSSGVTDVATVTALKTYAVECGLDADVREANIDNAGWVKPVL